MIELTKINGDKITINAEEIEFVETTHDTIISMCSGRKISVIESTQDITQKVIDYKNKINK
jgi:flagellar protein FlbD